MGGHTYILELKIDTDTYQSSEICVAPCIHRKKSHFEGFRWISHLSTICLSVISWLMNIVRNDKKIRFVELAINSV